MLILVILFSVFSSIMMCFVSINTQLGPWIGPVFSVVCVVLAMTFVNKDLFNKYVINIIATGSVGGIIGMSLGWTIPSFYLLHKDLFLWWLSKPFLFIAIITSFVIAASGLALFIAFYIKEHLIDEQRLQFPMSQLVHKVIFLETQQNGRRLIMLGIGLSSIFNITMFFVRNIFKAYLIPIQSAPFLLSIGFISGSKTLISVFFGSVTRMLIVNILQKYITTVSEHEFLIAFCLGMFIVAAINALLVWIRSKELSDFFISRAVRYHISNTLLVWIILGVISFIFVLLSAWNIPILTQLYVLIMVGLLGLFMARLIAQLGIIDIEIFAWFIVLPLMYVTSLTSLSILALVVFSTLCLALVIDFLFSYKLAQLSKISYFQVLKYQCIGSIVSAFVIGIFLWRYGLVFDKEHLLLFASKAKTFDDIFQFGLFDYKIVLIGIGYGLLINSVSSMLLPIAGAILMMPSFSFLLLIAGGIAYLVRDREKIFPLFFGIHAGHSFWLLIWLLM